MLCGDSEERGGQAETIARESEGSPFFIQELVQHIRGGAALSDYATSSRQITLDEVLWHASPGCPRIHAICWKPWRYRENH